MWKRLFIRFIALDFSIVNTVFLYRSAQDAKVVVTVRKLVSSPPAGVVDLE